MAKKLNDQGIIKKANDPVNRYKTLQTEREKQQKTCKK